MVESATCYLFIDIPDADWERIFDQIEVDYGHQNIFQSSSKVAHIGDCKARKKFDFWPGCQSLDFRAMIFLQPTNYSCLPPDLRLIDFPGPIRLQLVRGSDFDFDFEIDKEYFHATADRPKCLTSDAAVANVKPVLMSGRRSSVVVVSLCCPSPRFSVLLLVLLGTLCIRKYRRMDDAILYAMRWHKPATEDYPMNYMFYVAKMIILQLHAWRTRKGQ